MKSTTVELLDRWKAAKNIGSDYAAADELGAGRSTLSNWRKGANHAAPAVAARMARDLGMDELAVLAAIEADRTRNADDRKVWARFGRGAFMALVAGAAMGLSAPTRPAQPSGHPDVTPHYAKRRRARSGASQPHRRTRRRRKPSRRVWA